MHYAHHSGRYGVIFSLLSFSRAICLFVPPNKRKKTEIGEKIYLVVYTRMSRTSTMIYLHAPFPSFLKTPHCRPKIGTAASQCSDNGELRAQPPAMLQIYHLQRGTDVSQRRHALNGANHFPSSEPVSFSCLCVCV